MLNFLVGLLLVTVWFYVAVLACAAADRHARWKVGKS